MVHEGKPQTGLASRLLKVALVLLIIVGAGTLIAATVNHFTARKSESPVRMTIQIKRGGFDPGVVTVRSGTTVTWVNADDKPHRVTATPFPTHSDLPGLDSGQNIGPGNSYSYTFTKSGSFGFLDYLTPAHSGKVIVK